MLTTQLSFLKKSCGLDGIAFSPLSLKLQWIKSGLGGGPAEKRAQALLFASQTVVLLHFSVLESKLSQYEMKKPLTFVKGSAFLRSGRDSNPRPPA